MPSRFSTQVPLSNQAFSLLPVFHTCDGFDARTYVERNEIETTEKCEVFNEKITYLFYGRPAYKYAAGEDSTRNLALYPVAFVLNLEKVSNVKRIFPFDTGAMSDKRYKSFIHKKNIIVDFELEPHTNRINDVVLHFFGTNDAYLQYKSKDLKDPPTSFEALSYAEMLRSFASAPADERRATIEIQAEKTVSFGSGALIGLIIPTPLRDDPLFRTFVANNKLMIETYDIHVWNPAQCFGLISASAQRMLDKFGGNP
jgi:hypothetical protein